MNDHTIDPDTKPRKIDVLDAPIDVWKPMREGQPFLAVIRGLHMLFKAQTAMKAKKMADDFRLVEAVRTRGWANIPEEHHERAKDAVKRSKEATSK